MIYRRLACLGSLRVNTIYLFVFVGNSLYDLVAFFEVSVQSCKGISIYVGD